TPLALAVAVAVYLFGLMEPRATLTAGTLFLIAGAAAFGGVALQLWKSIGAVIGDPDSDEAREIRSTRRRRELEREKAAILKAIKELEFDHNMDKISDADYHEAHQTYRQRAVRIMVQLEAGAAGYREIIEREVNERLARKGAKKAEPPAP